MRVRACLGGVPACAATCGTCCLCFGLRSSCGFCRAISVDYSNAVLSRHRDISQRAPVAPTTRGTDENRGGHLAATSFFGRDPFFSLFFSPPLRLSNTHWPRPHARWQLAIWPRGLAPARVGVPGAASPPLPPSSCDGASGRPPDMPPTFHRPPHLGYCRPPRMLATSSGDVPWIL